MAKIFRTSTHYFSDELERAKVGAVIVEGEDVPTHCLDDERDEAVALDDTRTEPKQ